MPYSGAQKKTASGAVIPIIWYLLNLLAIPIIGFVVLLWLFIKSPETNELRRAHTRAALFMSLLGFVLISSGIALSWIFFSDVGYFGTFALVWAIALHTGFVLWGMVSLAQAMSDKKPLFPAKWL
ncbi:MULTISPECIES: hypothetical protein [unclassified Marinobacter]|uniref:hypothetical protein n=1 Tax=unclassified Marinobacter TaxID=83889 RepID=UPI0026E48973|nr:MULTISPECIES: hypothetical protein [unclassified Marinobacter]MDO6443037.1 hypothetical protein [Marinobacter sp. 2_MG-2023]MDO6822748.1 hypothetical protein [Marinobacter sp. 1_MG-2023]